jgi:GST-like protein
MSELVPISDHRRWPPSDPGVIQLYAFPTPNGVKVSIALEELGLPYEAHRVTLADTDVKSPEFLSLNPNNKIPAIIDPNGPGGTPIALWESGAILIYLAEKTGKLLGATEADKYQVLKWLMFQMGGVGPDVRPTGLFREIRGIQGRRSDCPRQRYIDEARRLLNVVEGALEGRDWIAGEFSIADIALAPWLGALDFYGPGPGRAGAICRTCPPTSTDSWSGPRCNRDATSRRERAEATGTRWPVPSPDQAGSVPVKRVAQDLDDLFGFLRHGKRRRVHLFQGVLMIRHGQHDHRLAQRRRIACVESGVPLFVLLTEADHDDIRRLDPVAGADRVDLGALVVMPELVLLGAEDRDTAIVACRMVRDRA